MAQLTIRDVRKAIRTFKKNGIPKKKLYYRTMLQDGTEKTGPIDELLDEKFLKELQPMTQCQREALLIGNWSKYYETEGQNAETDHS